jgi:hypothetical protein
MDAPAKGLSHQLMTKADPDLRNAAVCSALNPVFQRGNPGQIVVHACRRTGNQRCIGRLWIGQDITVQDSNNTTAQPWYERSQQ